jgi:L-aspartate oxidase
MVVVDPAAELAPRDIVARAVFAEVTSGRGAFLDCREAIGPKFPHEFPTVYAHARAAELDPVTDLLPVAPAQHYHMGGVRTDQHGRTEVPGLWAVGEVAATGLHGANRLASNSLIEAVVFASRAAKAIAATTTGAGLRSAPLEAIGRRESGDSGRHAAAAEELRRLMSERVGVIRDARGLTQATTRLGEIEAVAEAAGDPVLADMSLAARFVATAALQRRESRGGHFRSDYPETEAIARHSMLTLAELNRAASRRGAGAAPRPAQCDNAAAGLR